MNTRRTGITKDKHQILHGEQEWETQRQTYRLISDGRQMRMTTIVIVDDDELYDDGEGSES